MSSAGSGSPPDTFKLTTLLIKDIPEELNKRDTLLEHFSQFGEVTRVQCRSDHTAVVHFKQHGDALAAKNKGKKISPRFRPVGIQWCRMERQSSSEAITAPKSPLPSRATTNPFQANIMSRSNPFQLKQSTMPAINSPSDQTSSTRSASGIKALSSALSGLEKEIHLAPTKKPFGKRPLDSESAQVTTPVFKTFEPFRRPTSEKQVPDSPGSNLLATTENKKDGFAALSGTVAPPSTLFGKPIPSMNTPNTSAPAPMGIFGKPAPPSLTGGSEPASSIRTLTKPIMLFGKPVTEDMKPNPSVESKGGPFDKQPQDSGPFATAFKSRGAPFGAPIPPLSAMKWSADGATKDSMARTSFGSKQDALRPRTNLVWTKDRTVEDRTRTVDPPPRAPPPGAPKKTVDPATLTTVSREVSTAAPVLPKQLSVVTRSQTRSASPSKFAELFVHSANSVAERHKVLEMRDKIIREQMNSEVQKGPVKGTCTDMCPEKERYQRNQRNLVDKFEMLPGADGVMDHTRMVKEYQRSSADQEFPLPHELRPPPILEMTMNYLIREIIANQPNKASGDWFSFVWNRTRAIRKDITQQKIEADPISALILERCARFHIHCGHSLCEEDSHDFDSKLNNENLTKCLKSLKYSYADLKVQNVRCPNEAEFVAYEILLNLKEGFIAKMINDLEPDLRRDPQVRLSIAAMNALDSGNYRRFFKILRQVPYLAACILHRYFTEVRRHAVHVLSKSLSKSSNITLSTLTSELFFNSEDECTCFLATLNIEPDESGLINCKTMADHEDLRFDTSKSADIVQKMGTSLAQVTYGPGTIPVDNYVPDDSFTADGMFKKSTLGLPEDYKVKEMQQTTLFAPVHAPEPPKRRTLRDEDILPALESVMEYVQHEQVNAICREVALEQSVSLINLDRVIEETIRGEAHDVANEIFEQEKKADNMRRRALLSKVAHDLSGELVITYSIGFLRDVCAEALAEISLEAIGELASDNHQRILTELLADIVPEIANIEYEAQVDEYNTHLANNFRTRTFCKKAIKKWRKWIWLQKEIRDFPAAPNLGPPKPYPNTGRSYAEIRAEQVRLTAMRVLADITEKADTLPLNLSNIFKRRVRMLVVGDVPKMVMDKVKKLLSVDSTVRYQSDLPGSIQGFNVIVVLSSGSSVNISSVAGSAERLQPKPAVGILWCGHPVFLSLDIEEELLQKEHEPVCIPLCNLLKKLSRRVPEEVTLQRANLPDFIDRGMEFCLGKLSAPCCYLPVAVRLYNAIVMHLAAVATSSTLLRVNSLDDEIDWNGKTQLCSLYSQIRNLELPLPDANDRASFVERVQRVKKISLLTTAVNMGDFKDDFVLLRDILARFNHTLNPCLKVRYLEDDLRNFEVPDFWYLRPMEQGSRSVTPLELSESTESELGQEAEVENYRDRLENTIRSAREVLRRSELSYGRRALEARDRNLKRPLESRDLQPEMTRKRRSDGTSKDDTSPTTSSTNKDSLNRLSPGRLSKQTRIELDLFEMKRAIETLKSKARVDKLLKDA